MFLGGCDLPAAWANAPQWRILETGFGFGLNFLTTWQAWRADPQRPRLLHFVSIEAFPVQPGSKLPLPGVAGAVGSPPSMSMSVPPVAGGVTLIVSELAPPWTVSSSTPV